ncbi:unnamed protein product [Effrenium voratum]|nr:unnamed protein product [Effrenium voratum]
MRRFFAASKRGFSSLPVLDVGPFLGGSKASREEVARKLDEVCSSVGFFYLEGHGIPRAEVQQLHRLARDFFAQPQGLKDKLRLSDEPERWRGYQRLGDNVTLGQRDWHEALDFYAEDAVQPAVFREVGKMAPAEVDRLLRFAKSGNRWPQAREFREAFEAYFARLESLGKLLMEAMALGLGLAPQHFESFTDRSFWVARVIGYPPLPRAADVGLSCGEHSDYGCWTILSQDETRDALEVRFPDGSWQKVQPREDAFVINLGDMLSVWTQGRYVATRHRVRQTAGQFRTSVAFFYEPNLDAVIRPLDLGLASPQSGRSFKPAASTGPLARGLAGGPVVYGEHLYAKVSSNFNLQA